MKRTRLSKALSSKKRAAKLLLLLPLLLPLRGRAETPEEKAETPTQAEAAAEQIVDFYEQDRCPDVEQTYRANPGLKLPPIVMAVIANCLSNRQEAEQLFRKADEERPNNQTILLLYARSTWKTEPEKSREIWHRLRMVARDEPIKRIADDYLAGVVGIEETEQFSPIGKATSGWFFLQAGGNYTSNPDSASGSSIGMGNESFGQLLSAGTRLKRNTSWGDWGARMDFFSQSFYSRHVSDRFISRLDLPFSLDTGNEGSVVFTPFGANELQGGSPYHYSFGLGVMGISYRKSYRQSVQGIIYRDDYLDDISKPQGGTHFRFEYEWLFFPSWWEITCGTFLEHVTSAKDQDASANATLFYSHNDIGLYTSFLARLDFVELGASLFGSTRQDTNDSSYTDSNSNQVTKRRVDYSLELRPGIGIHLERNVRLDLYFEYDRVFSNFGPADYQDYNVINRTAGANLNFQLEWL